MESTGHIDYPLSTNYRKTWGEWEAVREIVQNALDTKAEVTMNFVDNTLTVEDHGPGFEMSHLLIGETEKDGETTIGKFGEGIKFALLTLLRDDCKVHIESNNIQLNPKLIEMFGKKCLQINYNLDGHKFSGTKVVIEGISKSYRDRFLSLNQKENFELQILLDKPKELYVKGIYVENISTIVGYNLIIERENPISGGVDTGHIMIALAVLIVNTDHKGYIESLLEAVRDDPIVDYLEYQCGSWMNWRMKALPVWKEVSNKILGSKACLYTSHMLATEAIHRGYHPIECRAYFLKGILKTDAEVIREDKASDVIVHDLNNLSFAERENIRRVLRVIETGYSFRLKDIVNALRIVDFEDETDLGSSIFGERIDISYKVLKDFTRSLDVILHEFVHFFYNYHDLTDTFVDQLSIVNSTIIRRLTLESFQEPTEDFLKDTPFRYKSKEECFNDQNK